MEIKIKNNILDSLNFEKNHNLIGKIREKSLEIMTQASIGLSEDFKMEENKLNIAKVICVVTSEDEGENIFKLTIERLLEFTYTLKNQEEKKDIYLKKIVEILSKNILDGVLIQAQQILKDAGLGDINLKSN